ncbi:RagB/SusD family nutrient uptake outer membrane protein [Arcticibacter tournemirensis]
MKRNKVLLLLLLGMIVNSVGCKDDFLQEKSDLTGMNDDVYMYENTATAFVDYVYAQFQPSDGNAAFIWELSGNSASAGGDTWSKMSQERAGETNYNKVYSKVSYTQDHAPKYFGEAMTGNIVNNPYTRIRQINLFLENIDLHGLPEDVRTKLKGQMYFWRAYQYFDLVRLYGGVPLILKTQNPIIPEGDTSSEIPRSTSSECIEQICSDLDMAISMLPGKWNSSNWGRITSGAAAAFKGRVLLTWASPLFNRTDEVSRWQRAYDANKTAMEMLDANGFGLFKTGGVANGTAWGNMWFANNTTANGVNNSEGVIVFGFNNLTSSGTKKNNGWENSLRSADLNGSGSIVPTKQMVDAFPMKDGKMPGSSTYAYETKKFYKNRDPRFYKTIVYNGAIWPYSGATTYKQWTYSWYKTAGSTAPDGRTEKAASASGLYLCKATNPSASNAAGHFKESGTDFMEMRYAEVVLNLAECAIGINNLSEGLTLIKSIRERAGIENKDGNYGITASSRNEYFAAVLNERKIELAYEGKRFWDLRRWLLFDDTYGYCTKLNMQPINGMRRTGYYFVVKKSDGTKYVGPNDPLKDGTTPAPVIQREPSSYPAGITTYDQYLDYLYDTYFDIVERDNLENTSVSNWKFTWYPQYYFFGLNAKSLAGAPYLQQTKDWDSLSGFDGFDPLK